MSSYDIVIENVKTIAAVSNCDARPSQPMRTSLWQKLLEHLSKLDLSPAWRCPAAEKRREVLMVMDVRKMVL